MLGWLLVQKWCFGDFTCQQPLRSHVGMRASLTAGVTLGKKPHMLQQRVGALSEDGGYHL